MGEELLSLKWNNHQSHFVDILTFLREQEIFIDATLACGGKLYSAHKFVLSTCSDYFKVMFTKNPHKHPIVFLKDVTCKDLEALLDFMYNGEVNVPQSSLGSLIKTAEGLQVKGLAVPDDPPAGIRKDSKLVKENRDRRLKRERSFSPPASKRLRETDQSPVRNSISNRHKSFSSSNEVSINPVLANLETLIDEDSRTSVHSGVSEPTHSVNAKPNSNNSHDDSASLSDNVNEPSPGPSGMHKALQSKEEELEIKQEDMGICELQEDGEWRDGDDNLDDRSGDSSLPSVHVSNFASDGLIPTTENTGDRAMIKMDWMEPGPTAPFEEEFQDTYESHFMAKSPNNYKGHSSTRDYSSSSSNAFNSPRNSSDSHSTYERFHCNICGKKNFTKSLYARHIRSHTGEKPFKCPLCPVKASQTSNLNAHIRTIHKVDPSVTKRDLC